ncbi:MAG TPA: hypothetical protein VGQ83_21290 [Polyangia bacterium]
MDPASHEQTELLRNIWNEMKALGQNLGGRIDQTNARLDQTNAGLEDVRTELGGRIDALGGRLDGLERTVAEGQLRVSQELGELAGAVRGVTDLLRERAAKAARLKRCEGAISSLKLRVKRLERTTG